MSERNYVMSDEVVQILGEGLWEILAENMEWDLLDRLVASVKYDYRVMIIPKCGFSRNDEIHNMVITWLRARGVLMWNVENEIVALRHALREGINEAEMEIESFRRRK